LYIRVVDPVAGAARPPDARPENEVGSDVSQALHSGASPVGEQAAGQK